MQIAAYSQREDARQRSLAEARALFERQVAETHQKVAAQHAEIDNFQRELSAAIAQITLRTLYEIFKADRPGHVEIIVFNGYVASTDKRTGHPSRTCLITVRTSRDTFTQLNLSKVDPPACLNMLNASVSKSPAELAPV